MGMGGVSILRIKIDLKVLFEMPLTYILFQKIQILFCYVIILKRRIAKKCISDYSEIHSL